MSDIDECWEDLDRYIGAEERCYGTSYVLAHLVNNVMRVWCKKFSMLSEDQRDNKGPQYDH